MAEAEIKYSDDIKVGVLIENGRTKITLGSDHETIERVARMILDDKRNITETTISSDGIVKIPSNSSSIINISSEKGGGKVEFSMSMVDDSSSFINKEITVNYSGDKVVFPAGTKITGPTGWTGEMSLPKIKDSPTTPSISGHSVNVSRAITIGDEEGDFCYIQSLLTLSRWNNSSISVGVFPSREQCSKLLYSSFQVLILNSKSLTFLKIFLS